jgi:hypothetical protein
MTNSKVAIITTINPPNEKLRRYLNEGYDLLVVGDKKTNESLWQDFGQNCKFLSYESQEKLFPRLSNLIGPNTYARKNLGYLYAVNKGYTTIFETDDDTFLREEVGDPLGFIQNGQQFFVTSHFGGAWNPFKKFAPELSSWPRGLPLSRILNPSPMEIEEVSETVTPPQILQTLVNKEPDLDAIFRLTVGDEKIDVSPSSSLYHLADGVYSPGNTQSTFWFDTTNLPFMYFPVSVSNRFADILKMYVAQTNTRFAYSGFLTEQERNPHDYMLDYIEESTMYLTLDKLIEKLPKFAGSGISAIYSDLTLSGICLDREIAVVSEFEKLATEIVG